MSSAWSWYVIGLVAINILGSIWLLWFTGKRRPGDPAPTDTSHVWDGDLTEYNKPMPRWWINLFYLTIVFSIGYLIWYPGLGTFAGTSGWTSHGELASDQKRDDAKLDATFAPFAKLPIEQIAQDPKALQLGRSIFLNNCAVCHGTSARGAKGFPNLTDVHWQWGGTADDILTTIDAGRTAVMPAMAEALTASGGPQAIDDVIAYVQSLSRPGQAPNAQAAAGKPQFEAVCAACHGADGTGMAAMGAPNLTDNDWLYGPSKASIKSAIEHGHNGQMPAFNAVLRPNQVRVVAAYVWSLSNTGNAAAAAAAK
jgi:cytochrome c oxidase cbb3-type subunit 3